MGISNFKDFKVNEEKLGVSFASIIFSNFLEDRVLQKFIDFYKSREKSHYEQDNIKWWRLQNWIGKKSNEEKNEIWKIYPDFPVVGFEIIMNFNALTTSTYEKNFGSVGAPVCGGGYASGFGHKNWKNYSKIVKPIRKISDVGLIIQMGVEVSFDKTNFDIENSEHKSELIEQIGSTLYHELNHTYEHYKRTTRLAKRDEIRKPVYDRSFNTSITYAENNRWRFAKPIWSIWSRNFLYYTYISEDHELNANVQEIYYYIKKYPSKDIKEFRIYQIADYMEKFDSDKYYNDLLDEIKKHNWKDISGNFLLYGVRDADEIANKLKEMWVSVYRKEVESQKATPMASFATLDKMTCLDFIKYWGKRFNDNGKYLKRKISSIKYEEVLKNS